MKMSTVAKQLMSRATATLPITLDVPSKQTETNLENRFAMNNTNLHAT